MGSGTRKKPRTYDHPRTRTAVQTQFDTLREATAPLTEEHLALPTRLDAWNVRELLAHLAYATASVRRLLDEPEPPKAELTPAAWASTSAPYAAGIASAMKESAAAHPDLTALLQETAAGLAEGLASHPGRRILAARTGAMTLTDYLATRCVELVVHIDDLNAAVPGLDVPLDRQALATATRVLADALALSAPGGSTEVRVPPFAVVQCVEGPRHTRGTPPNVVETDPLTWIRLATGRLTWAEAVDTAAVAASGERADLAPHLPVLS